MPGNESPERAPRHGWVLYDGACSFCSRWVSLWRTVLHKHGFESAALQEVWVRETLRSGEEDLLADIRVLTTGKQIVAGADAYRFVMRRIWWAQPLWLLVSLPGVSQIFNAGYRWFNQNRYHVSRACRLDPRAPRK